MFRMRRVKWMTFTVVEACLWRGEVLSLTIVELLSLIVARDDHRIKLIIICGDSVMAPNELKEWEGVQSQIADSGVQRS